MHEAPSEEVKSCHRRLTIQSMLLMPLQTRSQLERPG